MRTPNRTAPLRFHACQYLSFILEYSGWKVLQKCKEGMPHGAMGKDRGLQARVPGTPKVLPRPAHPDLPLVRGVDTLALEALPSSGGDRKITMHDNLKDGERYIAIMNLVND